MEHSNPSYIKILVSYYQIFISVKPTICLFNFKPIFVQLFIKINSYGRKLENEVGLQTRTNGGSNFFGYQLWQRCELHRQKLWDEKAIGWDC